MSNNCQYNLLIDRQALLKFFLAIAYGVILSQIPSDQFKDFGNYLIYAEHSSSRLLYLSRNSVLQTFANEPIWLLVNTILGKFLDPEAVVRSIILFSGTTVAWFVLTGRKNSVLLLLVFLLLPSVIKNHLIHIRQGLAISFFLLGWFSSGPQSRWFWFLLTPFVHASFFFVLVILLVSHLMINIRLGLSVRMIVFACMGIMISLVLGWLTAIMGARQAQEYNFSMTDVSGLGFVFWLGVIILMLLQGRSYLREHTFETGMILFYLITYWLIEVAARVFESGLLLVLLAGLALTGWRRFTFVVLIMVYGGIMWVIRIDQPAMGFEVG